MGMRQATASAGPTSEGTEGNLEGLLAANLFLRSVVLKTRCASKSLAWSGGVFESHRDWNCGRHIFIRTGR